MSAGTSLTDLAHQAYDAAANAVGLAALQEDDEGRPLNGGDDDEHQAQAQTGSKGAQGPQQQQEEEEEQQQIQGRGQHQQLQQQQQQQQNESENQKNVADSSDGHGKDSQGSRSWIAGLFLGPGNHPNDPDATIRHPAAHSPTDSEKRAKQQTGAAADEGGSPANRDEGQSSASRSGKDASHKAGPKMQGLDKIDNALGDHGPAGEKLGSYFDESIRKAGDGPARDAERNSKAWAGGAAVGEPIMSERNQKALEEKGHRPVDIYASHHTEQGQDKKEDAGDSDSNGNGKARGTNKGKEGNHIELPDHVDRAANRGPSWASRPNDEQREKIRKLRAEQTAGRSSRFSSSTSTPQLPDKSPERQKSSDGVLGSLFEGTVNRPGLHVFGGGGGTSTGGLGSQRGKRTTSSSTERPKREDSKRAEPARSNSQWAQNPRKLRSAFDAPLQEEVGGEPLGARPALDVGQLQESPAHESEPGAGTPLTPTAQKMRAISKIMLGGVQRPSSGPAGQNKEGESSGDTGRPSHSRDDATPGSPAPAQNRWAQLKKMVREKAKREEAKHQAAGLDLAKELETGILPVFLLKMAIERDEQKHRRIPVLLNHLRLRVTDSVNPLHSTHAVFRIELEYGNGLVKWVVYRELRDFINLHAHYRASALRGYLGRSIGNAEGDFGLPSFPKTSIPYLNQLQRQGRVAKADFAKAQRDALENYIIELIRRTMFRAEANRLCKFFEISALSVSLASRGGYQGKQGYLRILSKSSRKNDQKGLLTPARWAKAYEPKWFIVRESFIAIVHQPDTLQIYDVFLMDNDFKIERPKRLYKQTMHLAHGLTHSDEKDGPVDSSEQALAQGKDQKKQGIYDETALLTEGHSGDPEKSKRKAADSEDARVDPSRHASSHTFYVRNAERRLKLVARNEREMEQFISSMEKIAKRNIFSGSNRFESFAPIRLNASAQWLVDGRDYYWNVSKALMMAKDRIFIHDWWLSPELYLRRPGQPKWRLDNILKKKAEEGVKVFVIIYNEVSNNFTPTDSGYTKQRLVNLHHNIFVQRSPSHFQTGTFYWAHHEKLCVIDETIAFMGGLDLCFGRYDTPAHTLIDDAYHESSQHGEGVSSSHPHLLGPVRDGKEAHIWPGQDYANERVMEWHTLSKPQEDLFPRDKFPRMPWHDVGLQLVGQPARDLCRHFTQRWNLLLRIKNHTRVMPFLVPPPDFTPDELKKFGLTGSCEVQICRSAGPWSLGTASKVEHSIQNAYLKSIQMSDHFVYIENQFFITSTVMEGTKIENQIGEALVSRIIRAHREGTAWRAVVVIPLIPGFPMPMDHPDASSVRLIVDLQNRSISRGEHSIFGKLRREGINPEDYISFFSLRNWGKLRGGQLTTEQVYLHDKIMIVDDRLAIIGSANINERSQRGDRDSELACVIRDYDMLDSTMAGEPYKVGRFAHTLRVHLMREHLGVDVDELEAGRHDGGVETMPNGNSSMYDNEEWIDESDAGSETEGVGSEEMWDPDNEQTLDGQGGATNDLDGGGVTQVAARHKGRIWKRTAAQAIESTTNGAATEVRTRIRDIVKGGDDGGNDDAPPDDGGQGASNSSLNANERYAAARDQRVNDVLNGGGSGMTTNGQYDCAMEATIEETMMAHEQSKRPKKSFDRSDARERSTGSQGNGSKANRSDRTTSAANRHSSLHKSNSNYSMSEEAQANGGVQHDRHGSSPQPGSQAGTRSRRVSESTSIGGDDLKRKMSTRMGGNPWALPVDVPEIDPNQFGDPLLDSFYRDYWLKCAIHNTQIYRKVFKCVPDDMVSTWGEYKAYGAWADKLAKSGKFSAKESREQREGQATSVPGASVGGPSGQMDPASLVPSHKSHGSSQTKEGNTDKTDEGNSGNEPQQRQREQSQQDNNGEGITPSRSKQSIASSSTAAAAGAGAESAASTSGNGQPGSTTNAARNGTTSGNAPPMSASQTHLKPGAGFSTSELDQMEALLMETQGSLVIHPTRFLEAEDMSNNFLFAMDRINPLLIYN